jgi:hypothetical protein
MKTNFQNFIDMLDNADILYRVGKYNEAGAVFVAIGSTEFYFTLDGELADVKGY